MRVSKKGDLMSSGLGKSLVQENPGFLTASKGYEVCKVRVPKTFEYAIARYYAQSMSKGAIEASRFFLSSTVSVR